MLAVLDRGESRLFLEEFVEGGRVGEIEVRDNLLHCASGIHEHALGLKDDICIYPFGGRIAADTLDELRKVFRCQAETVRIEGHITLNRMVFHDERQVS